MTTKIIYAESVYVNVGFGGELHYTDTCPNKTGLWVKGGDLTPIVTVNRRVRLPLS
jgi:Zn-finger nucleic acid-binding protein